MYMEKHLRWWKNYHMLKKRVRRNSRIWNTSRNRTSRRNQRGTATRRKVCDWWRWKEIQTCSYLINIHDNVPTYPSRVQHTMISVSRKSNILATDCRRRLYDYVSWLRVSTLLIWQVFYKCIPRITRWPQNSYSYLNSPWLNIYTWKK